MQDVDYQVSLKKEQKPIRGRPTKSVHLTVQSLEFFVDRNNQEVIMSLVQIEEGTGKVVTSSKHVEKVFEKATEHVLRDI